MPGTAQRSLAALLALMLAALPVPPALAASPEATAELLRAKRLLEAGNFEQSVRAVESVLFKHDDLPEPVRAEAYRLLGLAGLYLGDETAARKAYEKLLEIQPDYELPPSSPPKVKGIYDRIQAELRKRRLPPVTLQMTPVPTADPDLPLHVRASIDNMLPGLKAKIYYRRAPARAYSSVDFVRQSPSPQETAFAASIPAYDLKAEDGAYKVEYYVEVADGARRRLAGRGTADEPLAFEVLPADAGVATARAWYKNPWVWIIGGVVVAAATTGVVLLATQRPPAPQP